MSTKTVSIVGLLRKECATIEEPILAELGDPPYASLKITNECGRRTLTGCYNTQEHRLQDDFSLFRNIIEHGHIFVIDDRTHVVDIYPIEECKIGNKMQQMFSNEPPDVGEYIPLEDYLDRLQKIKELGDRAKQKLHVYIKQAWWGIDANLQYEKDKKDRKIFEGKRESHRLERNGERGLSKMAKKR